MNNSNIKPVSVLLRPRITEKAALGVDKLNVYVFEVTKDATKKSISTSVHGAYGITPTKVRVVSLPAKKVFVRGKRGIKSGVKKAYVYLKKGDKIELI
ncbi:MAG: 50S ribosomal protein L23 [Candidatus Zambryskibacteria bacterium CG11_big_fil_rev_8_21_14_0_20_42_18]|uniref:50S ribosomal protein L23 n=1 Tax=Candidatus Zambryskibacteria bacterium CG_4_9_14_3_um_filter_42_15 TaxID=1975112 RepID=A0A2M7WS05_9BACT|nr:MAG: 50S ribosomal protein L23 [Candidatus Zambryskibacteria bacterium CG11_big_fil_rev_8_21_14_0_20_42_18]PJA32789.1 MAG: 50S ribosomal protein L23 [Candidatus Zambryskibacteria bacterium CG_4_9_14_3_um_filter_42_15]